MFTQVSRERIASAMCHQPSVSHGGCRQQSLQRIRPLKGGKKMINPSAEKTRRSAMRKLHPHNFTTTTVVRSLLAYLVDERWTDPYFIDVKCGEDGVLRAFESCLDDYLRLLISREELVRAVLVLTERARLTPRERSYLLGRIPLPEPLP